MRKMIALSGVCLVAFAVWTGVARAEDELSARQAVNEIRTDYSFERPEVSSVTIGDTVYDRITMPGVPNCGTAGQPALPARGANILLPSGGEVVGISVIPGKKVSLGSGYMIEPVSLPVKLSADPDAATPPVPDSTIYALDLPFPEARFENIGTYAFRGYRTLILKLNPVEYIPATGELSYYPRLTVVVETVDAGTSIPLFRNLNEDDVAVRAMVDNPTIADTYGAAGSRGGRSYELLILTTDSLAAAFQPLKDYHDAHGMPTEIHTTSEVGSTNPIDVRDYIIDRYNNDGIDYVIIGGDDDVIPAKDLYVYDGGETETAMPGDIYFACLDGSWNYDGDSRWGEPTDGEGGGDVDLVAEVYVGRAAVGNTTEANRFVDKTIWYLSGQHSQPDKVQLVGEYLGFGGPSDYAADTLEELIDGSSAHGYTTVGIPSDVYTVDELFERDMSWSQSDIVSRINNGVHFLNHLGHGSEDYAMKMYNSDVTSDLTNTDLCFVYSQTCLAGHFDGTDCWAETMNIKTDHGGFAVIMNARYGWGAYSSTDGPSQRFNREFWDAVFNPAEAKPEVGRANQDSKEDNIYRISDDCMRWCTYELTLFGDPTINLAEVSGMRVNPGTGFVSEGPSGGPFTPGSIVYTVENMGDAAINYAVTKAAGWITITNGAGTIPGHGSAYVTVSINSAADALADGGYDDLVYFTNTTDHTGDTSRPVHLGVGVPVVVYEWNMDTNPGWTTQGQWAWGQPTGGGGAWGGPDPSSGFTGSNVYGYNLNGDYTNSMPEYHLTTGAIDCSGLADVTLVFRRWLGVENNTYDHAYLRVSNNGTTWSTVWQNGSSDVTDSSWQLLEYDISAVADDEPTVYLRWTMGVTDGGWVFCGWNIDDVQIKALGGEEPALHVLLPDGTPEFLDPGETTTFTVQVVDGAEEYVPGSGMLHYRYDGGAFLTVPFTPLGGNFYEAALPPATCEAQPEFYVSAEGDGGTVVTNPSDAPASVFTAMVGEYVVAMEDNFETDMGWTVTDSPSLTEGTWERGDPVGWSRGDPPTDFDGSGQCYLTENDPYDSNCDVDDGTTWLYSPLLELGEMNDVEVHYALWYTNNYGGDPNNDLFHVHVSNNGGTTWVLVETFGPGTSEGWTVHDFVVDDYVTPTDQVMVRFEASDLNEGSVVEAAVDEFSVSSFVCESPQEPCPWDLSGDGVVDPYDVGIVKQKYGCSVGSGDAVCDQADVSGDGIVDPFDVGIVKQYYGPCP